MQIVMAGAGAFACPALIKLNEVYCGQIPLVITQPDRPAGRKRLLQPCPVKVEAENLGLRINTPETIGSPDSLNLLKQIRPDLLVVCDYGQFLPSCILKTAKLATVNIHPSLLPRYRGAAPIPWTLANGDTVTGNTILHVSEKMDAGDIILQKQKVLRGDETAGELEKVMAEEGAELLIRAIELLAQGKAERIPQDEKKAEKAPKLRKEDGHLNFNLTAEKLYNRVRAFNPWPSCFCRDHKGQLLKVHHAAILKEDGPAGTVLKLTPQGPAIATGSGSIVLKQVQPAGKKMMSGEAYCRGYRVNEGDLFT